MRLWCHAILVGFVVAGLNGCSGDESTEPPLESNDTPPANSSPQGALSRLAWALETEDADAYADLFTRDYTFRFSADTDPSLVLQYGLAFRRTSEIAFSQHLFGGFTKMNGDSLGAAIATSVELNQINVTDDAEYPDSTAFYRFVSVPRMAAAIQIPQDSQVTTLNFVSRQDFFLVRGDAAWLTAGQEARSDRWYIRGWDDRSLAVARVAGTGLAPQAEPFGTWGRLKDQYLR
jgi:hypothetical protein